MEPPWAEKRENDVDYTTGGEISALTPEMFALPLQDSLMSQNVRCAYIKAIYEKFLPAREIRMILYLIHTLRNTSVPVNKNAGGVSYLSTVGEYLMVRPLAWWSRLKIVGRFWFTAVVAVCVLLFINEQALAQPLPHEGMFILDPEFPFEAHELVMSRGGPSSNPSDIPVVGLQTEIVVYVVLPDLNLSLTNLVSQAGGAIRYTSSPMNSVVGGRLLIPDEQLGTGTYCFVEGNPSLPSGTLRNWCFQVAEQGSNTSETAPQALFFPRGSTLSSQGVYLYSGSTIIATPTVDLQDGYQMARILLNMAGFPSTTDTLPSILAWSPDLSLEGLYLLEAEGGIGVSLDSTRNAHVLVYSVIVGGPADLAGIREGDTLITANSMDLGNDDAAAARLLRGPVGSVVAIRLTRGTEELEVQVTRRAIDWRRQVQFTVSRWDHQTVELQSNDPLSAGVYCYVVDRTAKAWCFEIAGERIEQMPTATVAPTPTPRSCHFEIEEFSYDIPSGIVDQVHNFDDGDWYLTCIDGFGTSRFEPRGGSESPLSISTVTVDARAPWQATGISVDEGAILSLRVLSGEWTNWSGTQPYTSGEGGSYVCGLIADPLTCVEPLPSAPSGALIGRIGGRQIFLIGSESTIVSSERGEIELRINDGDDGLYDNAGTLAVEIQIDHLAPTSNQADTASVAELTPDFSASSESLGSAQLSDEITRTIAIALETILDQHQNESPVGESVILLIKATGDLSSIASQGLNQLEIICAPTTALNYLGFVLNTDFSDSSLYFAGGDYVCTYGIGYVATLEALASGTVPYALIPILVEPDKYVDPWLDPINAAAWQFPITCTLFPNAGICD